MLQNGFAWEFEGDYLSLWTAIIIKNMGIFRQSAMCAASIALLFSALSFSALAQSYNSLIEENPERAGGVYHYYEYTPSSPTKAPKGYKPFYISHYGRHGSRYHTSENLFKGAVETLSTAEKAGLLTEEGALLKRQIDSINTEHQGMFGMLTERGAAEHRGIAARMASNYPEVFKGNRNDVECVSSYWPRCLVSMANFTSTLAQRNGSLDFHYFTGPKYLDYISMDLDTKNVMKGSNVLRKHLLDSLVSYERFFEAMFTDPAKASELIHKPKEFMDDVFLAGCISPNTQTHPDIFKHFTIGELEGLWISRNDKLYYSFGISAEEGEYVSSIAKPLIEDIVKKADEALKSDSHRAADLRFGHDVGLLPLIGTIGIEGMEDRWVSSGVHNHWFDFRMMPMASNLQMVFFRNRKGDVLVKLVYNDKETHIPAVPIIEGTFHRWNDLREYLVKTAAAISDEHIVKDNGGKERTGVAGM